MTSDDKKKDHRPNFFTMPPGVVIIGLVVWILAGLAAVGADILLTYTNFNSIVARIAVTYSIFAPTVILTMIGLVMVLTGAVRWAVHGSRAASVPARHDPEHLHQLLESINARLLLSETAKRIAYRAEDIEALRQTIRKDIAKRDFDAALILVNEMAQNFGYREEAEEFRDEILTARNSELESKIDDAVANLDNILAARDFDAAAKEAAKLQRLYLDSERVHAQTQRVTDARDQYKQDLERQFLTAAERDDVDRAMDLLKELDKYLSETEAKPFRETARGVIGKKRDNLGVQFKLSVQDKEWQTALRVGEQIIREFPNTRMADEVRSMLDLIRQRSQQERAASST